MRLTDTARHTTTGQGTADGRIDAAGVIAADVVCSACGYNLRSLASTAACPECGRPVADSLSRQAMWYHDNQRLRNLAGGINAVILELGVLILVTVTILVIWQIQIVLFGSLLYFVAALNLGIPGCLLVGAMGGRGHDRRSVWMGRALIGFASARFLLLFASMICLRTDFPWIGRVDPEVVFGMFIAMLLAMSPLVLLLDARLRLLEEQVRIFRHVKASTWSIRVMAVSWLVFVIALTRVLHAGMFFQPNGFMEWLNDLLRKTIPVNHGEIAPVVGVCFVGSGLLAAYMLMRRCWAFDAMRRRLSPERTKHQDEP